MSIILYKNSHESIILLWMLVINSSSTKSFLIYCRLNTHDFYLFLIQQGQSVFIYSFSY